MKEREKRSRIVSCLSTLVLALLAPSLILGQGAPDIVWSRSDHTNAVNSVTFSQDGSLVASGGSDGTIRIWQSSNGNAVITLTNQNTSVLQVAFHSGGTLASWDVANALRVWQLSNGVVTREQLIPRVFVDRTAFSPKGDLFAAVGGYDFPPDDMLYVWRVSDGTLLNTFAPNQDSSPVFSADSQLVAAGLHFAEEYRMHVWKLSDGALVRSFTNRQSGVSIGIPLAFSPDSALLVAPDAAFGMTEIWGVDDGRFYGFVNVGWAGRNTYPTSVAFTTDAKLFVTGNNFDEIEFWRLQPDMIPSSMLKHDQETTGIKTLAISPKGDTFAYGRMSR